jgi:hypothetical protein
MTYKKRSLEDAYLKEAKELTVYDRYDTTRHLKRSAMTNINKNKQVKEATELTTRRITSAFVD